MAPDCVAVRIPKLTLVTFVENACVHGIESKTAPGWIFVRIYKENGILFHHIRGLIFSFQNTVHTDTLQRVEKKMRINLTAQEILLSNEGHNSVLQNFEGFTDVDRVGFEKEITL